jgi:hypothetical protein
VGKPREGEANNNSNAREVFHLVAAAAADDNDEGDGDGEGTEVNPLNAELNPVCHLLALLGAHHILHISRMRVKLISSALPSCSLQWTLTAMDWFNRYEQQGKTEGFRSYGLRRPCRWTSSCSADLLSFFLTFILLMWRTG